MDSRGRSARLAAVCVGAVMVCVPAQGLARTRIQLTAPDAVTAGVPFDVQAKAVRPGGKLDREYRGKVRVWSEDPQATIPAPHKFKRGDRGRFTYEGFVLGTAGFARLHASEPGAGTLGERDILVEPADLGPGGGENGTVASLHLESPGNAISPMKPVVDNADIGANGATSQQFMAYAFDAYGNGLGNVTSQTTFTISPDGSCDGAVCSGRLPGPHTVTGTYGAASGQKALDVLDFEQYLSMACRGENYDLNASMIDGCEFAQPNPNRTMQSTAHDLGSFSCDNVASAQQFGGSVASDTRVHSDPTHPGSALFGWDFNVGSAADWNRLFADGGACTDDLSITITTSGAGPASCYRLSVLTDTGTYTADVSGDGNATITQGAGAYSDDTNIFFKVERTCAHAAALATYTVTGHL